MITEQERKQTINKSIFGWGNLRFSASAHNSMCSSCKNHKINKSKFFHKTIERKTYIRVCPRRCPNRRQPWVWNRQLECRRNSSSPRPISVPVQSISVPRRQSNMEIKTTLKKWPKKTTHHHSIRRNLQRRAQHLFNAVRKALGVLQRKTTADHAGLKEQSGRPDGLLVILVRLDALQQLLDQRVARVELERLLLVAVEVLHRVLGFGVRLRTHQPLHVARPAVAAGHQGTGRQVKTLGNHGLFDLQPVLWYW